jgi:hypothetical protein
MNLEELTTLRKAWLKKYTPELKNIAEITLASGIDLFKTCQDERLVKDARHWYSLWKELVVNNTKVTAWQYSGGQFLPAKKEFARSKSVKVETFMEGSYYHVAYLFETTDPGLEWQVENNFIVPGDWIYEISEVIAGEINKINLINSEKLQMKIEQLSEMLLINHPRFGMNYEQERID